MEASAESPAQRQARIRREKREKKIREGGSSRLEKITALSGRKAEDFDPPPDPNAQPSAAPAADLEPDLGVPVPPGANSQNFGSAEGLNEPFPQLQGGQMWQAPPGLDGPGGVDFNDPEAMKQLFQQLMGMPPPGGSQPGQTPGQEENPTLPPGIEALLGQGNDVPQSASTNYWKVVHAVFSLGLALYTINFVPDFMSSKEPASPDRIKQFFWVFATAELILQSTRYFLERGTQEAGVLATVAKLLPSPWRERLVVVNSYSRILTTLIADVMVIVFVLGVGAWWLDEVN